MDHSNLAYSEKKDVPNPTGGSRWIVHSQPTNIDKTLEQAFLYRIKDHWFSKIQSPQIAVSFDSKIQLHGKLNNARIARATVFAEE